MKRQLLTLKLKIVGTLQGNGAAFKGFSLIELMIVIAIVGILATISVPSYMTYIRKARIVEVIQLLESATPQVAEAFAATGACPQSISLAGVTLPGRSVHVTPPQKPASVKEFWYNACVNIASSSCACQVAVYVADDLGGGAISLLLAPQPDGSARRFCGMWHPSEAGTTAPYLPSTCNNTSLFAM